MFIVNDGRIKLESGAHCLTPVLEYSKEFSVIHGESLVLSKIVAFLETISYVPHLLTKTIQNIREELANRAKPHECVEILNFLPREDIAPLNNLLFRVAATIRTSDPKDPVYDFEEYANWIVNEMVTIKNKFYNGDETNVMGTYLSEALKSLTQADLHLLDAFREV